jgi:hypothetical protein
VRGGPTRACRALQTVHAVQSGFSAADAAEEMTLMVGTGSGAARAGTTSRCRRPRSLSRRPPSPSSAGRGQRGSDGVDRAAARLARIAGRAEAVAAFQRALVDHCVRIGIDAVGEAPVGASGAATPIRRSPSAADRDRPNALLICLAMPRWSIWTAAPACLASPTCRLGRAWPEESALGDRRQPLWVDSAISDSAPQRSFATRS